MSFTFTCITIRRHLIILAASRRLAAPHHRRHGRAADWALAILHRTDQKTRYTGRIFLAGVTAGVTGAIYLALTTTFGWAFGFGILGLAAAWASITGMACLAIRKGLVEIHKEWMMRAYIVTFAFVTFRVFTTTGLHRT
jgi:predicted membrane protein DUF2306